MNTRKQHLIFTYGTLMRDEINHGLLATARFVAEAHTEPCFELFDLGHFPAMSMGGQTVVRGEVYAVDDQTLVRLDRLEGHPEFYQRTPIRLADGREVQTYLMNDVKTRRRPAILSGDWRAYRVRARGEEWSNEE
jgi:gamma-glutamylaminecyclotransferase